MAKAADIGGKRLISLAPDAWVKWVTQSPDVLAREILASEFQWVSRESDVVVKAYHPQIGDFLVLNELQLRYNTRLPRRMRAYAALAEERYNLPVYPVLINILPPSETMEIVSGYESQVLGLQARQDYRVINLWEVDAQIVFQQPLPSLLPFVPVLKGGDEIAVVQQAVQALRADEQLNELEPLLAFFASFVLSSPLVQQIMRWDMAVLQESPWYQEILQQGEIRGETRGETRGLLSAIELGLELKFGSQGLQLMPEISQITDLDVLRAIREGLRTMNSLEEIRQIYTINET
ncbi:Rpn family recombination-promoting nuclease/putative transposase [Tolypothrix sp. VBCCA 56010]|uniref:Rpn family recombination-promoting nuclease/putative transposase n=1 Tax=Tolypothrix sp. VBCCA 56010 TaxID=3137731 RepID=UPI003D7DACD3